MKKQLLRVCAHPATLPMLTAAYGVAAGYFVGNRKAEKNRLTEGGDVTVQEALDNPDQFVLKFPDMEAQESLSFDRPPKREADEQMDDGEVSEEDRTRIMKHLGRITEVTEDEDGTTVKMEFDEETALQAEAAPDLEQLARAAVDTYGTADEAEIANVFDNPVPDWDYEAEIAKRGPRDPYVIHSDEYHSEESGFRQAQLTYYAGDDVMTDEDDQPVFNFEEIIGPLMWGHGCNNGDLFYVRNPRLEAEYEITRSYESYAHAILGIEAEAAASAEEVRHSRRLPRLSQDD